MTHDFPDSIQPLAQHLTENETLKSHGLRLLKEGRAGTIALAGGHGSRLNLNGPKGCLPISRVHKKSLYQMLAERVLAASITYKKALPLAIMTSDATYDATCEHFETAHYFGLAKEQVSFFRQKNLPLQDSSSHLVLDSQGNQVIAPDGNGALFWHFQESGLLEKWQKQGIEEITTYPIDNALVDPFQPSLIAVNQVEKSDVAAVGVKKASFDESVGSLVVKDGKVAVIEYSELSERQKLATKDSLANISYFCFSMPFIQKLLRNEISTLPLHQAKKKVVIGNDTKELVKSEYFIFDLLAYSQKTSVLYLERDDYFAPIKNSSGPDSVETAQKLLEARDRRLYQAMTGKIAPTDTPFEFSFLYNLKK